MILESAHVTRDEFERGTGWAVKPEGACRGEVCVPLPGAVDGDRVDVAAAAELLRMPLVSDGETGTRALGPANLYGTVLETAQAPELVLPDLDGVEFALSSLRGRKVVLVAWAP